MNNTKINKRFDYLDLIRGTLLLYVILVHMSQSYGLITFDGSKSNIVFDILSFFMAPFYFFSGFLFSNKRGFKEYTINKIYKLLLPYLFWTIISLPIFYINRYIITGDFHLLEPFKSFIFTLAVSSNTPLWFFISLFAVNIIYYIIDKYKVYYVIILAFIFSLIMHNRIQLLSWGNISLGLVYFYLGHLFREKSLTINMNKSLYMISALVIFSLICILDTQNLAFVMLYQRKGFFILNLPYCLAACYLLWWLSIRIQNIHFINWIGQYSLALFASHRIILNWIYDPFIRYVNPNISYTTYILIGYTFIILSYYIIVKLSKKYYPCAIGLK